jgi:short-subunit dehydrogenase
MVPSNTTFRPKPLARQVMVITGASSGIGLATAIKAAAGGARLVLVARDEAELANVEADLRARGGKAIHIAADVADADALERVAERAVEAFGRIDTWINNAGVSIYGKLTEATLAEKRRLFDVNFWGVIHGCRAALPHLRAAGGTIINLGSVVSERVIPLQGMYCASKHAVKAYTDALRMELEEEGAPIVVTLVKPASIDTPFTAHAANHMDVRPRLPGPVYAPEVVADAILDCATHPHRDVFVGGAARAFSLMETFAPRLADLYMERTMFAQQRTQEPPSGHESLFAPNGDEGHARGGHRGHVARSSVYTRLALHPLATALAALLMLLVAGAAIFH